MSKIIQTVPHKNLYHNMEDLYDIAKGFMQGKIDRMKHPPKENLSFKAFNKIIRTYFDVVFKEAAKGYIVELPYAMGRLIAAKIKPINYIARKLEGVRFVYFYYWNRKEDKQKKYKLKPATKYRRLLKENEESGVMEYPDSTPEGKYGEWVNNLKSEPNSIFRYDE